MGTPDLQDTYRVNMGILIRASSPPDLFGQTVAASDCGLTAELVLAGTCACGELRGFTGSTFLGNNVYPSVDLVPQICVPYTITPPDGETTIPVIDNGNGLYSVRYKWTIAFGPGAVRSADTSIVLEITQLKDCSGLPTKIAISTVSSFFRAIPGVPLPSPLDGSFPPPAGEFFNHATPDWRGCGAGLG